MKKILIVDDRPINREVLSMLLDENQYEVLEAVNGLEALELAKKNRPDLIITDIVMPLYDGIFLVKELNLDSNLSSIPVIFYSASYKAAEAYRMADSSNVKYVLTKPCEPEIILGTIEGALDDGSTFFHNKQTLLTNEEHIAKRLFEKKQKNKKLAEQNVRLTNVIEIGLDMSSQHDIQKLMYILCKSGRQFLDASYAGLILQKKNEHDKYENYFLDSENHILCNTFNSCDLSEPLKDIFLSETEICIHSPIIDVEKIGLKGVGLPFSSLLSLPLRTVRSHYGKIYFINKSNPARFTLSNQRFMRTLADKFAINYENLILYQEVEHYSQQLEKEIIQRKQTEEELRIYRNQMAEVIRLSSLEELASSLAHEINQPLAAISAYIKGCINRIEKNREITPEIMETLNEVLFQSERAGEIIHRVKSFAQKGELFFEMVETNPFIDEVIHLCRQELQNEAIKIHYTPIENLPKLNIDRIQLQQVMLNLLRNAVEAMIEAKIQNPAIHIEVEQMEPNRISVRILDNGPGLPVNLENNVFDLYFTTKEQGMGMGLAICRSVIEAHSGQISAKRLLEGGSCFQFDLPTIN